MSLFVEGDKEKIRKYRKMAEKDGLTIRLYSEERGFPIPNITNLESSKYSSEFLKLNTYDQEILKVMKQFGRVRPSFIMKNIKVKTDNSSALYWHLIQLQNMGYIKKDKRKPKLSYYELDKRGLELFT